MKIRLTGLPFSIANRREVEVNGDVIGVVAVSRNRHNWNGNGTSYQFHPNEAAEEFGYRWAYANKLADLKKHIIRQRELMREEAERFDEIDRELDEIQAGIERYGARVREIEREVTR